jgi:hypothetical protein
MDDKASLIGLRDKILRAPEGEHAAQADEITQMRRLSAARSAARRHRHAATFVGLRDIRLETPLGAQPASWPGSESFSMRGLSKPRTPTGRENATLYPAQRGAGAGGPREALWAACSPGILGNYGRNGRRNSRTPDRQTNVQLLQSL